MSKVARVLIDDVTYLPIAIQKPGLMAGETPQKAVERLKADIAFTFTDDLVFYNEGDKYLTVVQFQKLPEEVFKTPIDKQKIELFGTPGAKLIHRDDEPDARVVKKITINGVIREDVKKKIRETLSLDEGDKITLGDLDRKERELLEKCALLGVQIKSMLTGDKGEIELVIKAFDEPRDVVIKGIEGDEALEKEIKTLVTKEPLTKDRIAKLDTVIASRFKDDNFLYIIQKKELDEKTGYLILSIAKVPAPTDIAFSGIDFADEKILKSLFPQPLSNANIDIGIKKIKEFYFKRKLIPAIQIDFHKTLEDTNVIVVTVATRPAPTSFSVKGRHPLSNEAVIGAFGAPSKDFQIYTPEMIAQGIERVRALFKKHGLILSPKATLDINNGELLLDASTVRIKSYNVIMVGKKDAPSDGLVLRELEGRSGEFLDEQKLETGIWRLKQTDQFTDVHYELDIDPKSGEAEVNVICTPKNGLRRLEGKAGYLAGSGANVGLGIGLLNKVKEGARSDVTAIYSPLAQSAMISFSDPWMFPGKTSGSLSFYASSEQYLIANDRLGVGASIGIPLGNSFSPWRITLGTNAEYIKMGNQEKIGGMNSDNFLLKPLIKLSYNSPAISTYMQGKIAVGAMSYQETRVGAGKSVDLIRGLKLLIGVEAGKQFGQVPTFDQFGPISSPSVYGRALNNVELGLDFAVASANIQFTIFKSGLFALGAHTGITAGGVGEHKGDVGAGAGLDFMLFGAPIAIEFGVRRDMLHGGAMRTGINIIGGKFIL